MKKNLKTFLYILGLLVVAVVVYIVFFRAEDAQVTVETVNVAKGEVSTTVTATGTIEPTNEVDVGTQVSGVIEKIYVDYNDHVEKGQIVAELDKTSLQSTVDEARASLKTAQNELDYRQKLFDRIEKLHNNDMVSDEDYDEALYNLNNAKGTVEQNKSDLKLALTNLGYASIYSPIKGVVLSREVEVGQTVAASYETPTLFTIAQDLTQMQVEADVDEADIGQVKLHQRVTFQVDAYPDDVFSGTVTQVRLEPNEDDDSGVVTYTVIIKADNPDGKLMPGLTASIAIYTMEMKDILTLPMKAISFTPQNDVMEAYYKTHEPPTPPQDAPAPEGGEPQAQTTGNNADEKTAADENVKMVWVKKNDDIHPQKITTGVTDGINIQVVDGLKAGDEVITSMQIDTSSESAGAGGDAAESPFMPKPPGRDKKKK